MGASGSPDPCPPHSECPLSLRGSRKWPAWRVRHLPRPRRPRQARDPPPAAPSRRTLRSRQVGVPRTPPPRRLPDSCGGRGRAAAAPHADTPLHRRPTPPGPEPAGCPRPPLPHAPLPRRRPAAGSPRSLARPGRGPGLRRGRFLPAPSPPREKKNLLLLLPRSRDRVARSARAARAQRSPARAAAAGAGGGGEGRRPGPAAAAAARTARTAAGPRARDGVPRPGFASVRPRGGCVAPARPRAPAAPSGRGGVYFPSSMISNTDKVEETEVP